MRVFDSIKFVKEAIVGVKIKKLEELRFRIKIAFDRHVDLLSGR